MAQPFRYTDHFLTTRPLELLRQCREGLKRVAPTALELINPANLNKEQAERWVTHISQAIAPEAVGENALRISHQKLDIIMIDGPVELLSRLEKRIQKPFLAALDRHASDAKKKLLDPETYRDLPQGLGAVYPSR